MHFFQKWKKVKKLDFSRFFHFFSKSEKVDSLFFTFFWKIWVYKKTPLFLIWFTYVKILKKFYFFVFWKNFWKKIKILFFFVVFSFFEKKISFFLKKIGVACSEVIFLVFFGLFFIFEKNLVLFLGRAGRIFINGSGNNWNKWKKPLKSCKKWSKIMILGGLKWHGLHGLWLNTGFVIMWFSVWLLVYLTLLINTVLAITHTEYAQKGGQKVVKKWSKSGQKLLTEVVVKNCWLEGGWCQKYKKNVDVFYGRPLSRLLHGSQR